MRFVMLFATDHPFYGPRLGPSLDSHKHSSLDFVRYKEFLPLSAERPSPEILLFATLGPQKVVASYMSGACLTLNRLQQWYARGLDLALLQDMLGLDQAQLPPKMTPTLFTHLMAQELFQPIYLKQTEIALTLILYRLPGPALYLCGLNLGKPKAPPEDSLLTCLHRYSFNFRS